MDLETIALIAMGGCLFLWLVVNFIITLHNVRIAKAAGLTIQVQCEKCGTNRKRGNTPGYGEI